MSSKERIPDPDFSRLRVTLFGGKADRVPLLEHTIDKPVKEAFLGRKIESVADDIAFWREAGYDHYMVGLRPMAGIDQTGHAKVAVKLREDENTSYGDGEAMRGWVEEGTGVIDSWDSFNAYPWLAPEDIPLDQVVEVGRQLPEGMEIIPLYGCILNGAQWLMGFNNFCIKLCEDPELVEAVIRRVGELNYAVMKAAVDLDHVGALWYADDLAHDMGLMASPEFLRRHITPWIAKIGQVCADREIPFIFHSDGDVGPLVDDLVECGVNCLQPVEPKAMNIAALKKRYGKRLSLAGNIDLGYTLTLGPPEGVRAEVRERIRAVGRDGGYCVGSSNSVTNYVPLENFRAMLDATVEFGAYPLAESPVR